MAIHGLKNTGEITESLRRLFHLYRKPVGVKFLAAKPLSIPRAFRPIRHRAYYCFAVKQAAMGRAFYMDQAQCACDTGGWITGLLPQDHFGDASQNIDGWLGCKTYFSYDVARAIYEGMTPFNRNVSETIPGPLNTDAATKGLLIGSLDHFSPDLEPDVVLLVGPANSMMRMVQSYAAHFGWTTQMKTSGMCGICYEATVQPLQNRALTLSTLCSGTRFYAKWADEEMAAGIPYSQLMQLLEGALLTVGPCETDAVKRRLHQVLPDDHKHYTHGKTYFEKK